MPNTLAHLGIQGIVSGSVFRSTDLRWIFVGCVIPDLPWILNRAVRTLVPDAVSPYDLRLYAIAQSSLLVCLLLCGALACFSARPTRVFAILGLNTFLHLLLDAAQTKWANGVHLLAPASWELLNLGLFWPEHAATVVLTLLGATYVVLACRRHGPGDRATRPRLSAAAAPGAVLLVAYLGVPLLLLEGPFRADNHFVETLRSSADRTGRYIEFDRRVYRHGADGDRLLTYAGEWLLVAPRAHPRSGTVSVKGRFVDARTIEVSELHAHWPVVRDAASYVGLSVIVLLWIAAWSKDRQTGES